MKKINILLILTVLLSFVSIGVVRAENSSAVYQSTKYIAGDYIDSWNLTVDANDNVYHMGSFSNSGPVNFNPDGSDTRTSTSSQDGYFTKYNADGSYAWTRTIAGPSQDYVFDLAADSNSNIYAVGSFQLSSVNFDENGSELHSSAGLPDGFITKYSPDGNHIWTIANGNTTSDSIKRVVVDSNDDIIVVGKFGGTMDFDPGVGVDNITAGSGYNTFISKFSSTGAYLWTKVLLGNQQTNGGSINLDASGNIYLAGGFNGTVDFDPSISTTNNITAGSSNDLFVLKLTSTGNLIWVKTMSGSGSATMEDMDLRESQIILGGRFFGPSFNFNPSGTDNISATGSQNGFVSSWTTDGSYNWTRTYGNDSTRIESVAIDKNDDIYATGTYSDMNINFNPAGSELRSVEAAGEDDVFVLKLTSMGDFQWVRSSVNGDYNFAMAVGVTSKFDVIGFGALITDANGTNMNENGSDLFGDGSTFDAYLTRWSQTFTQDITNLPSGIEIKDKDGNSIPPEGFEKGKETEISLYDKSNNIRVVMLPIILNQDVDWSQVDVGVDTVTGKSFVKGLNSVVGPSNKHSLSIPKIAGQNGVIICPLAESLEEVSVDCVNKVIYTEDDPNLSIEIVNGNAYWVVAGLSGTGGVGGDVTLEETGTPVFVSPVLGSMLIAAAIYTIRIKRSHYKLQDFA